MARSGIDGAVIDDVIVGCVSQGGEQSFAFGRNCVLASNLPQSVPAVTIDRQCGSSQQAVQFAAQAVMSGTQDVVVAMGVESMTRVPMGSNVSLYAKAGLGEGPFSDRIEARYGTKNFSQFIGAEMVAQKHGFTRAELDAYALESHRRAGAAADAGYFASEIAPMPIADLCEKGHNGFTGLFFADETIRRDTSLEKLATLKTSFRPENGRITAGNSSQISDGAAALLVMSADTAKRLGLKARARIKTITTVGADPTLMLTGPIAATQKILQKAGLRTDDIDLFEINEAFASVPIAWMREMGVSAERLNVNGGAIALGHPLGASGARIMTSMLNELERRKGRYALQAICCAGGLGTATLIERLS